MEQIDTLIISGGGIKSVAVIGSLNYLNEIGILKNIKKYAGTSAGSFIITLLVMNYTPDEIEQTVFSQGNSLIKESYFMIIYNMFKNYGIYSANKMYNYLESLFEAKGFNKNITFKQLYEKTSKILTLTGTSVSEQDTFYFNCYTQPNMKVIDAVRISISIPIYFTSVKHIFNSQIHTLVDGGVLENFPLYYYDICELTGNWIFKSSDLKEHKKNLISNNLFVESKELTKTIGILLSDKVNNNNILKNVNTFFQEYHQINNISDYFTLLMNTVLDKIEESNFRNPLTGAKDNFFKETIIIELPIKVSAIDFNLSKSNKNILITTGYDSAKQFFILS